ncbi:MAG: Na/Pi symporter [Desulfuromonadaceae bacterium]|nr:Na/Pi symporter [Desulfuromonadaceae bacterium]
MPFSLLEGALGGIGLFLLGMRLLSDGIRTVADDRVRNVFRQVTSNRYLSLLFGTLMTLAVSSGSAAVIFTIGLLNGGILSVYQAICVLSGVLLGASLSLHLQVIPFSLISGPLILCGVLLKFFSRKRRRAHLGTLLLGIGLLLLGLSLLQGTYRPIGNHPLYDFGNGMFYSSTFMATLFGSIVSFLVQSEQSTISIIASLENIRPIDQHLSFAMTSGGVMGMAVMGGLASVGGKFTARRVAILLMLVTLLTSIPFLIFAQAGSALSNTIASLMAATDRISVLSWGFTISGSITALLLFAIGGPASRLLLILETAAGGKSGAMQSCAGYLDRRIISTPPIAIEQARKEIIRMAGIVSYMYADVRGIVTDFDARKVETVRQHEQVLDSLNTEINSFLAALSNSAISPEINYEIPGLIQVVSTLEHIGDVCEDILECIMSRKESGIIFSEEAMNDLVAMAKSVNYILADAEGVLKTGESGDRTELHQSKNDIRNQFEKIKQSHYERICSGSCHPRATMLFQELSSSFIRIAELCWNIIGTQLRRPD